MTWLRKISRMARAGAVGREHADAGHDVVGHDERRLGVLEEGHHDRLRLDVAGHHHGPRPGGARQEVGVALEHLRVAAVGAADEQDDVGLGCPEVGQLVVVETAREDQDDLAAAGEGDPAPGLGGDELLVADDGDAQPASRTRAGEHVGADRTVVLLDEARQAGVVPVEHVTHAGGIGERGRMTGEGQEVT